jgi:predicted nucleotidyltransferase
MNDQVIIQLAVKRRVSEFRSELLGVLVGGSRLRSEGDAHSDVDIVAVVDRPCRKRWNFLIDGIEIETFINPAFQMRRYFEEERLDGRGVMPHLCSSGQIVYDPHGLMAELQDEARAIWNAGPPLMSDRERWQFRYNTADFFRDLADVESSDDERAAFLIGLMLPRLIDQHYRISGRWLSKPKRVLKDLETWDVVAAGLARQACNDQVSTTDRGIAIRELADYVLAPLGGLMPLEWSTEWENLVPSNPNAKS